MRGTHTLASLLPKLLSKFKLSKGTDNPYYGITIPERLKRLWQLVEFVSAIPILLLRFILPSALGYRVVADRYVPDSRGSKPLNPVRENIRYELMEHRSLSKAAASTLLLPSNALTRHWLKEADEVVCVSKKQAEIISGKLNIHVKVVCNPLPEIPLVTKKVDAPSFLYTSGTSYLKGMHMLLEASKRLLRRDGAVRFVVTKGLQSLWQRMLTDTLAAAYQILGWVKYKELHRLHSFTQALIFPSIWEEDLPYAVSEAMLHGTMPIASKVGGVPEIVQDSFAENMLFQPGDAEELVDKMETTLIMNNEQITDVGCGLRESVLKRLDPETTRNRLMELFPP